MAAIAPDFCGFRRKRTAARFRSRQQAWEKPANRQNALAAGTTSPSLHLLYGVCLFLPGLSITKMELMMNGELRPKNILLATDLSPRCDRALERAIRLAEAWSARLIAATVVEHSPDQLMERRGRKRPTTPVERARRTLESHLGDAGVPVEMLVATGAPAAELQSVAEKKGCDLIVTGIARNDTFGSLLLGGTAKRLIRNLPIPTLVVHDRPVGPYRNIIVATDRSDGAREALLVSAGLFPEARFTLFHAHDVPVAGRLASDRSARNDHDLRADMLADIMADPRVASDLGARLELVVETGAVERLISEFAEDRFADLTVVGSHGHGAIFEAIIGSTERKLLDSHSGDLLIISSSGDSETRSGADM